MSLYIEGARFLRSSQTGSLFSNICNDKSLKSNAGQLMALISSAQMYQELLEQVIKASQLMKTEKKVLTDPKVALLMVHDLLLTKQGRINAGKSPQKEAILRNKTRLKAELIKYKVKHKISNLSTAVADRKPDRTPVRWIRVNGLFTTEVEEAQKIIDKYLGHLKPVDTFDKVVAGTIYKDTIVRGLYGISPSEKLAGNQAYKTGKIIIQDRASCFPGEILCPAEGDTTIDACAAPGNKTTHVAAQVGQTGKVYAFERDHRRAQTLKKMVTIANADKIVNITEGDFTKSDPMEYADVTGMIVDPSCSGSGIFGRGYESEAEEEAGSQQDANRLQKLSDFQYIIMRHALSFPSVRKVVYSTCSIHAIENEKVVQRLLNTPEIADAGWRLTPRERVLPSWHRRGHSQEFNEYLVDEAKTLAEACVRSVPIEDGGIGFFAACFERDLPLPNYTANDLSDGYDNEEEEWQGFE